MKKQFLRFLFYLLIVSFPSCFFAQVTLDNFVVSPYFDEQVLAYDYGTNTGVRIEVNAPAVDKFDPAKPTAIVMYGLPNGNTIDWTIGKQAATGDDWHYQIQHIGAQTRFVRNQNPEFNLVTVYVEPIHGGSISWTTWKGAHVDWAQIVKNATDEVVSLFSAYQPYVVLNGHSGGGNLPFGFLEAVAEIPNYVKRISFLDSNYNWDKDVYGAKLVNWLKSSTDNKLSVIAYNDSIALLNGQPIVSATGGTWYRSRVMHKYLKEQMPDLSWVESENDDAITYSADNNRIQFLLKKNPDRAILHTVLVEKNGYVQSLLSGTSHEGQGYDFYGNHAYDNLVQSATVHPHVLRIPPRKVDAIGGAAFMQKIKDMSLTDREYNIYKEISQGNIPNSHRQVAKIKETLADASGANHEVEYQVMPDFLAVGSDDDFCRVPMLPETAQRIAILFGAALPTSKLSDLNHKNAEVKLSPKTMTPDATMTTVPIFIEHNQHVEDARKPLGKPLTSLMMGHKKDIVVSNLLATKPGSVIIYGWHYTNGTAIQPIYSGHSKDYVDYSHGARMINQEIMVDGAKTNVKDVLRDATKYKMLSNEVGAMTVTEYAVSGLPQVPSRPLSFAVINLGYSYENYRVKIKTEPSVSYRVIYGLDPNNLDKSFEYDETQSDGNEFPAEEQGYLDSGFNWEKPIFVAVEATNMAGTSPRSEMLAISSAPRATCGCNNIYPSLFVSAFDRVVAGNTYDFIREHIDLESLHFRADVSSATNDAVIDGLVDLKNYDFVDYILGEESTADNTFNATEQNLIKTYLENGGKLLVSGAEIGWDLGRPAASATSKAFMENYLKCTYAEDNPGGTAGVGLYRDAQVVASISDFYVGTSFSFADGQRGTTVKYPDVLAPAGGATGFLQYQKDGVLYTNNYAGVKYKGRFGAGTADGAVVTMGIPFESIGDRDVRNNLMAAILEYSNPYSSIEREADTGYRLSQNYPNPAKGATTISYAIPVGGRVNLVVWNSAGQQVASLVDEIQEPGEHIVEFDTAVLAQGVYFYRLTVNDFSEAKKIVVME